MSLISSGVRSSKSLPKNTPADVNAIEKMKKQTSEMESQIRILKTKIQRSNSIINSRKRAVQSVYSVPKEKQKICTASSSNISYLRKDVESTKRTKEYLEKTLHDLLYSDKYDSSRELKVDILTHYSEQKRLNEMLYEVDMSNKERVRKTHDILKIIEEAPMKRRESTQLKYAINDSNDRLLSYHRANQIDEVLKIFNQINSGQSEQEFHQKLEKELEDLKIQLQEAKNEADEQKELEFKAREGLQQALDTARDRLFSAIDQNVAESM